MLNRFSRFAIAVALALSIGLHWGVLQTVAWVGMVMNYSRDGSVAEALEKTLDGKHPCAMCLAIAKAKKSEKKSDYPKTGKQLEFAYLPTQFVFSAPTLFWEAGLPHQRADTQEFSPPKPPPRNA